MLLFLDRRRGRGRFHRGLVALEHRGVDVEDGRRGRELWGLGGALRLLEDDAQVRGAHLGGRRLAARHSHQR